MAATIDQIKIVVDTFLATAAYASKVAVHCTLHMSPGAFVFQRDMILNGSLIADLHQVHTQQ